MSSRRPTSLKLPDMVWLDMYMDYFCDPSVLIIIDSKHDTIHKLSLKGSRT